MCDREVNDFTGKYNGVSHNEIKCLGLVIKINMYNDSKYVKLEKY